MGGPATKTNEKRGSSMSDEEKAEREHFRSVLSALKNYKVDTDRRISRSYDNLHRLEVRHQQLLTKYGFVANLEKTKKCVFAWW